MATKWVVAGTIAHRQDGVGDHPWTGAGDAGALARKSKGLAMNSSRVPTSLHHSPQHGKGRDAMPVIDAWERTLRGRGMADSTVAVYRQTARALGAHHDVRTVTARQLEDWLAGQTVGRRTRNAYVVRLRQLFKWLVREGYRSDDPTAVIAMPKAPALVPRPLPDRWFAAAWAAAGTKERAWMALGAWCGLRASEAALVRVEDFADGWLRITGKGDRTRYVPVRREVMDALDAWGWPDAGRLFPGVSVKAPSVAVGRVLRSVGAPAMFSYHSYRHRFATQLYASCGDLRVVQQLLGHSSLATTAVYLQVDDARARDSVLAMPGMVA